MKRFPDKIDPILLAQYTYLKALNKKLPDNKNKESLLEISTILLDKLIPEHNRLLTQLKLLEK
jgi:hypothetical protein